MDAEVPVNYVAQLSGHKNLRGPVPKKRPMISGSKIESADFYLPSRGYYGGPYHGKTAKRQN